MKCFILILQVAILSQPVPMPPGKSIRADDRQDTKAWDAVRDRSNRTFRYLISERHLYDLLTYRTVREELGLGINTHLQMQKIIKDTEREVMQMYARDEFKEPGMGQVAIQLAREIRAKALEAMRGLLTESQHKRFPQVAYYCEIDYLGLDLALTEGKFGGRIGWHREAIDSLTNLPKSRSSQLPAYPEENFQSNLRLFR